MLGQALVHEDPPKREIKKQKMFGRIFGGGLGIDDNREHEIDGRLAKWWHKDVAK